MCSVLKQAVNVSVYALDLSFDINHEIFKKREEAAPL